ncbi:MAG: NB-ARC domain-containing protein [Candidatus Promineifilaceae bacterium]
MEPLKPLDQLQLQTAVHDALSDWTRSMQNGGDLSEYLLLVRERICERKNSVAPFTARQATYSVLEETLARLAEQDETGARVLRARFLDGEITRQVASRLHASPDQVNRWQRLAIETLTSILMTAEMHHREVRTRKVLEDLPAGPYSRLFGFQELQAEIADQLLRPGEPLVVALSGIGGIGKTSLADAVLRLVAPALQFERILWVKAAPGMYAEEGSPQCSWQQTSADIAAALFGGEAEQTDPVTLQERLTDALRDRPLLVCIDNLEQEEQTVYFLEQLRRLAGPGKFLLTTRARPTVSAPAYFRSLEELSFHDAADLLRYQTEAAGTYALADASDDDIQQIYRVTGGNPLALRLVAGLTAVMSLPDIIAGLEKSRPGLIEDMYRAIYLEAWQTLSADAQDLLQAMPLVAHSGALPEQMQAISGLEESSFWSAVHELFTRSLLEVGGTVRERRYSIHRLTETFLRTEIVDFSKQ